MAPTPLPTSKATGSKAKPNKNSNDDFDIYAFDEKQTSKKRSLLVRAPSVKSVSTRSSTSSIKSTESNLSNKSQSSKVDGGKKQSSKRQKVNISDRTEKQSPVHVEQKIMGQNHSQAEAKTEDKSDGKNQLETLEVITVISDSSSDNQTKTADEKLEKSQVVLTRIDESIAISGSDNMKPKHSKRKTPEDGFGGVMGMAKRSKVSRQSEKSSPQRIEMVSSNPAISSFAQSKSLSDGLVIEEDDPFTKAMKELENDDYELETGDDMFLDLELIDPLALTVDEQAGCSVSEYQTEAAENPTKNAETIEHDYESTSNMNSSSEVGRPRNGKRDEPIFESDSEDDEVHNDDEHESDGEAAIQDGQSQKEVETNEGSSPYDRTIDSDDDVLSIFGNDDGDSLLEADITENTQSKRQMQVPQWKNQTTKTNEVPKLIPGLALTSVPTKSPRIISKPSTSTASIQIKDFAKQNDSTGTFTRMITNNLPLTPSSRDPREQKRLMLAEKQNAMHTGESSVHSQMSQPSTSNKMQPPATPPPRKPVKERLGLKDTKVPIIRTINTNKKIPCLMSLNPFATTLKKPVEAKLSDIPNLPAYLPRDEPQGEILPELEVDNTPKASNVPKLPQISRVNIKESLVLPAFAQGPEQYRPVFGYLFERVCRPFMNEDCSMNPNQCKFNHRLPDVELFGNSIEKMLVDDIVQTYETFMLRVPKLFDTYFNVLASYFAKKQRRDVLKRMIIDCDTRFKQHFFPHIVKCFMEMGDSYSKALAGLIQSMKNRTTKTSHEIVKMILDARNTNIKPFFKVLHRISEQKAYTFSVEHANRLLRLFDSTRNQELAMAIFKITVDTNLAKLMDQEYLKKFAEHYKNVPASQ